MALTYDIISIGTLSKNRLWKETQARRTAHATTTLIRDEQAAILVDPSLPAEVLVHRLDERTGLTPDDIDVVFLTNFRPVHRRGLRLFNNASWFMHEPEIVAMSDHLDELEARDDESIQPLIQDERTLLQRIQSAPERISEQVHLYPTAGVTPGAAGLLLTPADRTILIAGDAVLSRDHFHAGQIYQAAADIENARESLREISEIADTVIPGHDNIFQLFGR